jgi:hypothetical protein
LVQDCTDHARREAGLQVSGLGAIYPLDVESRIDGQASSGPKVIDLDFIKGRIEKGDLMVQGVDPRFGFDCGQRASP